MASKAAVGAVVAAAVVGGVARGMAVRGNDGGGAELAAARSEIATLRGRVDELVARPAPAAAVPPAVEERMAGLQRRVEVLESAPPPGATAAAAAPKEIPGTPARVVETPEQKADRERRAKESLDALEKAKKAFGDLDAKVEELRRRALDRSLAEDERILALQKLRFLPSGIDADVIQGMTAFFRETAQASTRDSLLRELHNTRTDEVKALFLEALRSDADEKVRVRAAGDIDTWRDDPAVVQALESARDGDSSEAVRKRAARTLASEGNKKD